MWTGDGRTTEASHPISSPLRLRGAKKKKNKKKTKNNQEKAKQKCCLATASNEITGVGGWGGGASNIQIVCDRPTFALSSALVSQTLSCSVCVEDS